MNMQSVFSLRRRRDTGFVTFDTFTDFFLKFLYNPIFAIICYIQCLRSLILKLKLTLKMATICQSVWQLTIPIKYWATKKFLSLRYTVTFTLKSSSTIKLSQSLGTYWPKLSSGSLPSTICRRHFVNILWVPGYRRTRTFYWTNCRHIIYQKFSLVG